MKSFLLALACTCLFPPALVAEIPNIDDFRVVPQFPQSGEFAFGIAGTSTDDGRLLLWNGETVYLQPATGSHEFTPIATGYPGDPGFVAIAPDGHTVALGAGFSGDLFLLDLNAPTDGAPSLPMPSHFSGAYLNDSLLIMDRGTDDFSASELIVVDLSVTAALDTQTDLAPVAYSVLRLPAADLGAEDIVVEKPASSYSGGMHIDATRESLYVMDANTRELRQFSVAALIEAFETGGTLDWSIDGTLIGQAGDFYSGGVAGITPDGELVIGGSSGFGNPGGVQYVDPTAPAMILATLDPAGNQPFYYAIYNRAADELIAVDNTFGEPLRAYARTSAIGAVPPESPCEIFDDILLQWEAFVNAYGLEAMDADLNADTIADRAMLLLVQNGSCNATTALGESTRVAYDANLGILDAEAAAASLADYRELVAVLMLMSADMQADLVSFLTANAISLTGAYTTVTCVSTGECAPVFVEEVLDRNLIARSAIEPYSAEGDFDGDGFTNLTEYENVIAMGGVDTDFAIAASSPELDGTGNIRPHASSGGCFIATAAFGTPMSEEINVLRTVRDTWFLDNAIGASFVETYYRLSPPIADSVAKSPTLRSGIRFVLTPIIAIAKLMNEAPMLMLAMIGLLGGLGVRRRLRTLSTHA